MPSDHGKGRSRGVALNGRAQRDGGFIATPPTDTSSICRHFIANFKTQWPDATGPTESDSVTEQLLLGFVRMSGRFATQPPHRLRPAFFDNVGRAFVEWEWGLVGTLLIACGFAEKKEGSKEGENLSNYTTHSWRLVSLATLNSARCCLTHLSSRVTFLP